MPLSNNFLFTKIFGSDKSLCLELLRRLFPDLPIGDITYSEAEKAVQTSHDSRGIRLDVLARDGRHLFDLEMQTTNRGNLPKRSRCYSSALDSETAAPGSDFASLKPTYVIFICTFPVFNGGRHQYTFRRLCVEDRSIELHDETSIVFLSTRGTNNDIIQPLKNFLNYLNDASAAVSIDDDFIHHLDAAVANGRQNAEWRRQYMLYDLERNQFRSDCRAEGRAEIVRKLIMDNVYSDEQLARISDMPVEEIRRLREELTTSKPA